MSALPASLYIPTPTPLEPIVGKHQWLKVKIMHEGRPYEVPKHMRFSKQAWESLPGMVSPHDKNVHPNAGYVETKASSYTPPEAVSENALAEATVKPTEQVNVDEVIAQLKAGEKVSKNAVWAVAKHLNIEAYTTKAMPVLIETIVKNR